MSASLDETLGALGVVAIDSRRVKRSWCVALVTSTVQGIGEHKLYSVALETALADLKKRKREEKMYAERPSQFYVEWDSEEVYERLKARAIKRGTFREDNDDWYEPFDIVVSEDDIGTIEAARRIARQHLDDAHFGQVRIMERFGIEEVGDFWDVDDAREVEVIE